jgi:hypothetical protein
MNGFDGWYLSANEHPVAFAGDTKGADWQQAAERSACQMPSQGRSAQ